MSLGEQQREFIQAITKAVAYAVKADKEVVQDEMILVEDLLRRVFDSPAVLSFVKKQLVTSMVRSQSVADLAKELAKYFIDLSEEIVLIHFMVMVIGSDNRLEDIEFKALATLFAEMGMSEADAKKIDHIYFRSKGQVARAKETISELPEEQAHLAAAYQKMIQTFHTEDSVVFGEEIYRFIQNKLDQLK